MPTLDLILAQIADPFRIALILGLVLTQRRTAAVTGRLVPLAAGVIFVAVLLPVTTGGASGTAALPAIVAGLVSNLILLVPILAAFHLWERRGRG